MKFTFHTSLIALVFAVGAADTFAAPAVRQLGGFVGTGSTVAGSVNTSAGTSVNSNTVTAPTAPSGITSSRAGSIRSTARPTVKSNDSEPVATVATGTAGANRSASTPQRLSIGPYIGAPRQISSGGGGDTTEITNDIKNINNDIQNITNILDDVEADISGKVDKEQGINKAGQALVVGTDGFVTTSEFVTPDELNVDLDGKVDKVQGIGAAGHVLSVDADGRVTNANEVYFKPEMDAKLAEKVDILQGRQYKGKALVVDNDGKVKPIGEFMTPGEVDISGKVDIFQGPEHAGNALIVNEYGYLQPTGDFVNADQGVANHGKALVVNADGRVVPSDVDLGELDVDLSGKVDKLQGDDHVNEVLVVGSDGKVTDQKIVNANVADDAALERAKMARTITDTLDWVDAWKNQSEDSEGTYKLDSDARYVMALDEYGEKAWFKVIVTGNE